MKKRSFILVLMVIFLMAFSFSACSNEAAKEEKTTESSAEASVEEADVDGSAYGYGGTDPVEAAVYKYMAEEVSKNFEKADVSIPTVSIVAVDYTKKDEIVVYGDFWVENYNVEGDTLKCVSGGNFPGVMHLRNHGGSYTVSSMDVVEDGGGFNASAQKLFGDHYDDFMKVYSDSDERDELRKITVSDYVNYNGLSVTQYQDEGWDPVKLYK